MTTLRRECCASTLSCCLGSLWNTLTGDYYAFVLSAIEKEQVVRMQLAQQAMRMRQSLIQSGILARACNIMEADASREICGYEVRRPSLILRQHFNDLQRRCEDPKWGCQFPP